jgi:thioredoxin reductase (NADPH)
MSESTFDYEVIIAGGGPAGLAAAIYATRARRKTLLLDAIAPGGQMIISHMIENYPAFPKGIPGTELGKLMEDHARAFDTEIRNEKVENIGVENKKRIVATSDRSYSCGAVIISTGASPRKLAVPGERELTGKGVSYCGTCDGMFFRGKEIVVVGGGDAAIDESLFLTKFVTALTVIHRRDQLRAEKILQERAFANPKIRFLWDSVVTKILGSDAVTSVIIKNVKTGEEHEMPTQGVFIFIGHIPNTGFVKGLVAMNDLGFIATDHRMATSVPGIFAAGDVRQQTIRQIVTAAGEGATAAYFADKYLSEI